MLELFERFVKALEMIAATFASNVESAPDDAPAAPPANLPTASGKIDYAAIAADTVNGRNVLLGLLNQRSIPVPPRTKTPTLVQMLTQSDMVAAAAAASAPACNPAPAAAPAAPAPDPLAASDPLGLGASTAPPAVTITKEMVLKELQRVMADQSKGVNKVVEILKANAGVIEFSKVTEDKYPAVYAAAKVA